MHTALRHRLRFLSSARAGQSGLPAEVRGSREILPSTGGRAQHRRGERAGERAGGAVPAERPGADTGNGRGGNHERPDGRPARGRAEALISARMSVSADEDGAVDVPSYVDMEVGQSRVRSQTGFRFLADSID